MGLNIEVYQGVFSGSDGDETSDIGSSGLTLIDSVTTPFTSLSGEGNFVAGWSSALDLSGANTSDPLWLRISNAPGAGSDNGSWSIVDNVSIVSIPEPSVVFLGSLGMLSLLRR